MDLYFLCFKVEQKNMDFFSLLVIHNLSSAHTGEYTCRATNDFGTISHTAPLIVKGTYLNINIVVACFKNIVIGMICTCTLELNNLSIKTVITNRITVLGVACSEYFSVSRSCGTSAVFC